MCIQTSQQVFDHITRFNLNLLKLFGVYAGVIPQIALALGVLTFNEFRHLFDMKIEIFLIFFPKQVTVGVLNALPKSPLMCTASQSSGEKKIVLRL